MRTSELQLDAMALTAEDVLAHFRSLPQRERLKLVERVVHEAAEAADRPALVTEGPPLWEDVPDEEFAEFQENLRKNRRGDVLRTP